MKNFTIINYLLDISTQLPSPQMYWSRLQEERLNVDLYDSSQPHTLESLCMVHLFGPKAELAFKTAWKAGYFMCLAIQRLFVSS